MHVSILTLVSSPPRLPTPPSATCSPSSLPPRSAADDGPVRDL